MSRETGINMFIVGRIRDPEVFPNFEGWELMGVFSSEENAKAACTGKFDYVAGPLELDVRLPDEMITMPVLYFPNVDMSEYELVDHKDIGKSFKVDL